MRRIAWRLQANAEGGLSERARQRTVDVADEADLEFQGGTVSVEVLEKGFRYQEQVYRSLSAVARQVSGVQWNGFAFFSLPVVTVAVFPWWHWRHDYL
ncbi:MAG: DUF2924 domain-containing protein [Bryobacteraceae bacterium]